ncbi:MAG TPA: hypothetical protein VEK08_23665 [Planctomycetota bacterium]|nr:hypothetical protein [Planctomycetota bacterium]
MPQAWRGGTLRSRGVTLLEIIVILLMVIIAAGILLPMLSRPRTRSIRTSCASNLNQIAKAMFMYADVPANGIFPTDATGSDPFAARPMPSLNLLYRGYIADPKVFSCPSNPVAPALLNKIQDITAARTSGSWMTAQQSSYGYDPGHDPNDAMAAIAADAPGTKPNSNNHGQNAGQNVLIGAGTVEFIISPSRPIGDGAVDNIYTLDSGLKRNQDGYIRQ